MREIQSLDLTGTICGKWRVVSKSDKKGLHGEIYWNCICDCGTEKKIVAASIRKGVSKSCGCAGKDWCRTHGMEGTSEYNSWAAIIQRCENTKSQNYKNYGARGIRVCKRWRESFENFYADMGPKTKGSSIDRINNDGNYEPGNCRWTDQKTQSRNQRNTIYLEYKGERRPMAEWAELMGLKRKILENRIRTGWEVSKALEAPSRKSQWN